MSVFFAFIQGFLMTNKIQLVVKKKQWYYLLNFQIQGKSAAMNGFEAWEFHYIV